MLNYAGKSVQCGVAFGEITIVKPYTLDVEKKMIPDTEAEVLRVENAMELSRKQLEDLYNEVSAGGNKDAAEIVGAHQMMLEDENFKQYIIKVITEENANGTYAVDCACNYYVDLFNQIDDEYLKERAADIKDVSMRIIQNLLGISDDNYSFSKPTIIVAEDLTPSQTIQMDKEKILAIVTVKGSANSHTAILARLMNIPAIVMTPLNIDELTTGMFAIVNGNKGEIIISPTEQQINEARIIIEKEKAERETLAELKNMETVTSDGRRIELCANIASVEDLHYVLENDAEGIGLFRSEFLYLGRNDFPSEEEQFDAYKKVLSMMNNKRVVIRTLDIGADKKVDYFNLDSEANPALGYRAIRICLTRTEIFKTQLRALFRASIFGKLAIMYPMITSVSEIERINKIVDEVKSELDKEGIPYGIPEQGIMIETPAAALVSDDLAEMVDFFSVGTNDLTQYTLAIDRENAKLDEFCDTHHKAILRLIKMASENIHKHGKWIGICGELGADLSLTETFLELEIDELSVSPAKILPIRKKVRSL